MPGIQLVGQAGIGGNLAGSPQLIGYNSRPGNALIAAGYFFHPSQSCLPTAVTDTAGNRWQLSTQNAAQPPTQELYVPGNGYFAVFIAWCIAAAAVTGVTVARQDSDPASSWWRMAIAEFSGIVAADDSNAGDLTTASATFGTPSVNLRNTGDLVVAVAADVAASFETPPLNWVPLSSGFGAWEAGGYVLPGVTGAYSQQWGGGTAGEWLGVTAAFTPSVPAPADSDGPLMAFP